MDHMTPQTQCNGGDTGSVAHRRWCRSERAAPTESSTPVELLAQLRWQGEGLLMLVDNVWNDHWLSEWGNMILLFCFSLPSFLFVPQESQNQPGFTILLSPPWTLPFRFKIFSIFFSNVLIFFKFFPEVISNAFILQENLLCRFYFHAYICIGLSTCVLYLLLWRYQSVW